MRILIIAGGSSSERKISLISGRAVRDALRGRGHEVKIFDFKKGVAHLEKAVRAHDITFPVMHGREGEDGNLYSFFGRKKKPYVGSDPKGARIAFDKILFKKYCGKSGIPTATWRTIKSLHDIEQFGFPSVLKAASGGSSHEVALLHTAEDLRDLKVKKILKLRDSFFVEELLNGIEITIGVLHGKALPVVEITPPDGGWFDYENKYSGRSRETPFAPSVNGALQKKAQKISESIHRDLKLGNYSRTDVIVRDGKLHVLETNTPGGVGLTPESLFPKAGVAAGMSFGELLERVIAGA